MADRDLRIDIHAQDRSTSAFASLRRNLDGANRGLKGLTSGLGALRTGAAGLAALASSGTVVYLKNTVAELAKLADTADRVGVTAEALQQLRFAAEQAGGSVEAVDAGLEKFAANLADASAGGGELYKVLEANNVAFRDAQGKILPTVDLVRTYADLVRNARTPQEALELAIRAFGRAAGPELVGMLKEGGAGLDEFMRRAAVTKDEGVQLAAELDDAFAAFANTLQANVNNNLLGVLGVLRKIAPLATSIANAGTNAAAALKAHNEGLAAGENVNTELLRLAQTGVPQPAKIPAAPTVLPVSGRGGGGGKEKISDAQRVLQSLREEHELLGLTNREREIRQALQAAGSEATSAEQWAIEGLTGALYDQEQQLRAWNDLAQVGGDAIMTLFDGIRGGKDGVIDALEQIAEQLLQMVLLSTLLGQGPLAGIMGTAPTSGSVGGLLGGLIPGRASGGPVSGGRPYMVGERGPELFVPGRSGSIIPNHRMGGTTVQVINQGSPLQVQRTERTTGPGGREMFRIWLAEEAARGTLDKSLGTRFGLKTPTVGR